MRSMPIQTAVSRSPFGRFVPGVRDAADGLAWTVTVWAPGL